MFEKEIRGLHEAAYLLAIFTIGSQILALVRDRVFAHLFGASSMLDAYYAAFRIPDFLFVTIASVVSLFVLIPIIIERRDNPEELKAFLSSITRVFFLIMAVAALVAFLLAPLLIQVLFPAFSDDLHTQVVRMTRIMLLSPFFLGLSNILMSVTQVLRRVYSYAVAPLLYNLGIIVGAVLFYPAAGLTGLAWGVVLGALGHLAIQLPSLVSRKLLPPLVGRIRWREALRVASLSLPRTLALSLSHITMLVLIVLAGRIEDGSIAIFTFALNLQNVPLSVIGVSYSVAAFPTLADFFARGERDRFLSHIVTAVRHVLFWSMPALVLLVVLRAQVVRVILGTGAFDWADTRLTAAVLALFVISLAAQGLHLLFVRGYYAAGMTSRPLFISLGTTISAIFAAIGGLVLFQNVPFMEHFIESLLRINDLSGSSIAILGAGYSIGMLLGAVAFWAFFRRDFGVRFPGSIMRAGFESFSAAVIGGAAAYIVLALLGPVVDLNTFLGVLLQGGLAGITGLLVYATMLFGLGNVEMREVYRTLHSAFWKTKPMGREVDELHGPAGL